MLNYNKSYFTRYLNLLGIPLQKPSLNALTEIVKTQMFKIPFENISKIYYFKKTGLKGIPEFDQYLSGIENYHFGGTCYTINYYLYLLLAFLGYDVRFCGADMSRADVHTAIIVSLGGQEYIVDAGYAAPFLEPLPCSLNTDYVINLGKSKYILKPQDAEYRSKIEYYQNGSLRHGYMLKPQPRHINEFNKVIIESFNPDATFMNSLLLTKYSTESSYIIHNNNFTEIQNNSEYVKSLIKKEDLIETINNFFGMPAEILETVINGLSMNHGVWD